MKKTFKYLGILASVVLMGFASSSCIYDPFMRNITESSGDGLDIKVFFPTKVVTGQPMTINGSGFKDTKEIVFPDGIKVTDFEIVSDEMIRVTAPAGISSKGGLLEVRTLAGMAKSRLPMTLGCTNVSGYSKQEGETASGGELISIYGEDLEFISGIEVLDADGNPYIITEKDFYSKGTNSVVFYAPPTNIYDGTFVAKVYTYDGKEFLMPELKWEPGQNGGHWETVKTILWNNESGEEIPSWGGKFRFGLEGNDGNNECIATFPAEIWNDIIKEGTFRAAVKVNDASNIRVTTGWWTGAYGGTDHNCLDMIQEEEDGTKYIEINIKEDGNLYANIDQQHLLFTGDAYTLLYIYTVEEIWIDGPGGHWERKSLWKNESGEEIPSWGGKFRFGLEGNDGNNECIATFPAEIWNDIIKEGTFRAAVKVNDASNIRVTTGWWTGAYGGTDHNCLDMIQEEEDGTKYIEINIKEDGNLYANIDQQHLLFTGDAYTLLEIYVNEWVEGDSKTPVVMWENSDGTGIPSWGGTFRFGLEGNDGNNECIATFPAEIWNDIIKEGTFRAEVTVSDASNIRITTGWWTGAYGGTDHNCLDMVQEAEDGTKFIEINIKEDGNLYDNINQQHLLFTGDGYTLMKLYYYE